MHVLSICFQTFVLYYIAFYTIQGTHEVYLSVSLQCVIEFYWNHHTCNKYYFQIVSQCLNIHVALHCL